MRWLVLTDDYPPATGGVAAWTARVVGELRRRGHHVDVFARARPGLPDDVVPVRVPGFGRRGHLAMAWAARHALAELPADRILCSTWTVVPPRLEGCHVVVHGSDVTRPARHEGRRRRVLARSRVGAVSGWLAARILAEHQVRARVLPAPVPVAEAPSAPGGRWLWMGRAVPGKGGDRFVRWCHAAGVGADVVGTGPELQRWAQLAEVLGVDARFHGWRTGAGLWDRVRRAQLVALSPSPAGPAHGAEGLGMVGLEALGQGTPVVGVAVGGVPEAVGPGLVLPDPDDPVDVARRVAAWWRPERGREGWSWVRARHGASRTVDALMRAT